MSKIIKLLVLLSLAGCVTQPIILEKIPEPLVFEPAAAGDARPGVYPFIGHAPPLPAGSVYIKPMPAQINNGPIIDSMSKKNQDAMDKLVLKDKPPGSAIIVKPKVVDRVLNQLTVSSMAFSVTEKINVTDDVKVRLVIDPTKSVQQLIDQLKSANNKTSGEKINVSHVVEVQLVAPDFEISKNTPDKQAIAETAATKWEWRLNPKNAGSFPIELSVNAVVTIDNEKTSYHINTFNKTVIVEVTKSQQLVQWLEKYWQWIIATLLLPLAKFLWSKYSSKE